MWEVTTSGKVSGWGSDRVESVLNRGGHGRGPGLGTPLLDRRPHSGDGTECDDRQTSGVAGAPDPQECTGSIVLPAPHGDHDRMPAPRSSWSGNKSLPTAMRAGYRSNLCTQPATDIEPYLNLVHDTTLE